MTIDAEAMWRRIAERIEDRVMAFPAVAEARDELAGMYALGVVLLRAIRLAEHELDVDDKTERDTKMRKG